MAPVLARALRLQVHGMSGFDWQAAAARVREGHAVMIEEGAAENARLRARVAELEPDAARYRWLREQNARGYAADMVSISWNIGHDWMFCQDLDKAVDDSRARARQGAAP
jgi:hypothetical protein